MFISGAYRLEGLVSRTTGWIWLASDPDAVISMWPESQSTVAVSKLEARLLVVN